MGADLDKHIGLRDVDGVVAHLAQEHCAHLQSERINSILCHMCAGIKQPATHHSLARNFDNASSPVRTANIGQHQDTLLLTVRAIVSNKGKGFRRGVQYLRVALEGGQHARALRMRGATKDEGPPEALRILAQGKDVV